MLEKYSADGMLALNEPIVLHFSQEVHASQRASAISVFDMDGNERAGIAIDLQGNLVVLQGELPTKPDMSDGTFTPGKKFEIVLAGAPNLNSLRSKFDHLLSKTERIVVDFLPSHHPQVLTSFDSNLEPISLLNLARRQPLRAQTGEKILLKFDGYLDPRTLGTMRLVVDSAKLGTEVEYRHFHEEYGSVLEFVVPQFDRVAYLLLPKKISGIGNREIIAWAKQFRIYQAND